MNFFIKFATGFMAKYFTTLALEKIVIILLGALVKRTESKVDDELFQEVFKKTN